jgi:lipopolysaccharide transport system permease protein
MTEYEIKPAGRISLNLKELWQHRELFFFFTWRDIKVKYKQTFFGFAWAVIQPLIMMLIFTAFFGNFLHVPHDEIPYPVFVYSGLMVWTIFASGLTGAGNSMISNANIIKKIYFPRLIIPVSSVLVALFDFLMTIVVYIGLLIYYRIDVNVVHLLVYFPLSIVITLFTTLGAGTLIAALNVKFRDFRYVIPFLIQALMFLTPVIYPVSVVTGNAGKFLLSLNPMTSSVTLARAAISAAPVEWPLVMNGVIISLLFFSGGLVYFRKTEAYFADIA